jgi:hypothetical protein
MRKDLGFMCHRIQSGQSPWPLVSVSDLAFGELGSRQDTLPPGLSDDQNHMHWRTDSRNDRWLEESEGQARVEQSPYLPSEFDWDFLLDDDSLVSV